MAAGGPILARYERVCFDKAYCSIPGKPDASRIALGHPLLQAVIDIILERNAEVLKQGAVFVDDNDLSREERLLFYVENAVQDECGYPTAAKGPFPTSTFRRT